MLMVEELPYGGKGGTACFTCSAKVLDVGGAKFVCDEEHIRTRPILCPKPKGGFSRSAESYLRESLTNLGRFEVK